MRSSKIIIKSNAQKQIAKSDFGQTCHDLHYFELGHCFSCSLNSLSTWGHHQKL